MDKEDFYDMMLKMCKVMKRDCDEEYEQCLDQLDFSNDEKEQFNEMI